MFSRIYTFFIDKTNKKIVFAGLGLILIFNLVLFPLVPRFAGMSFSPGWVLDLKFGFQTSYVYRLMNFLGDEGRRAYLYFTLFVDMPYLIIYAFTYAFLIAYVLKKKSLNQKFQFLLLFPFIIALFDLLENAGIVYLLLHPYDFNEKYVVFISFFNQMKWILAALTFAGFLGILFIPAKKK